MKPMSFHPSFKAFQREQNSNMVLFKRRLLQSLEPLLYVNKERDVERVTVALPNNQPSSYPKCSGNINLFREVTDPMNSHKTSFWKHNVSISFSFDAHLWNPNSFVIKNSFVFAECAQSHAAERRNVHWVLQLFILDEEISRGPSTAILTKGSVRPRSYKSVISNFWLKDITF